MIVTKPRRLMCAGVLCFASIFAGPAEAVEVYPGCAVPPTAFKHVWYIDPVNGKTAAEGGHGTSAAPWNSLQAVFSVQPGYTAPLLTPRRTGIRTTPRPPMCSPLGRRPARSNLATKSCS